MIQWKHWPVYAIMLFAIGSGQLGRLAQHLERGGTIGRRQAMVELMMLPGLASLGGALAVEHGLPVYAILVLGIAAGWLGLSVFRLVIAGAKMMAPDWLRRAISEVLNPPKEPPAGGSA